MLSMLEQRRRRAQLRHLTRQGYQPWEHARAGGPPPKADAEAAAELSPKQQRLSELRARIAEALGRHDLPAAADAYPRLLDVDPEQVLGMQQQLDVANQLMSEGRHSTAATAYELFLRAYASYPQREQVQLILGLIYARYLSKPERARELLTAALPRLEREQKGLAEQMLQRLPG